MSSPTTGRAHIAGRGKRPRPSPFFARSCAAWRSYHSAARLRPWIVDKQQAIGAVERLHVALAALRPVPPPKWVIASSAAVGLMWGSFADELRDSRIPDPVRINQATRTLYVEALEGMTGEIKRSRARPAMMKCIELSVKYQFVSPRTSSCEAWLVKNEKKEFHAVEEIVPRLRSAAPMVQVAPLP